MTFFKQRLGHFFVWYIYLFELFLKRRGTMKLILIARCYHLCLSLFSDCIGERGGSVVECRTPEREVRGSRPTAAVLCPWARHFTPRKYWLITQEAMAPSRYDWKIVDWDVKPQHNQPTKSDCINISNQNSDNHLCLSLFSNCINISNLNSDSLFVNNHEDQKLSTINICLLHCARIICNLPGNNSIKVWQR